MKNKLLKKMLLFTFLLIGIINFTAFIGKKANAEASGWVYSNNSWRYYSGPSIETGWHKYNGNWYYLDENGLAKTGWIKSEGIWYFLDYDTGKMLTGWIEDKGKWYYLNDSGEMVTGWLEYNGNLYYLNSSGVMVKDIYIGAYYLGPNGAWKEGRCYNKNK